MFAYTHPNTKAEIDVDRGTLATINYINDRVGCEIVETYSDNTVLIKRLVSGAIQLFEKRKNNLFYERGGSSSSPYLTFGAAEDYRNPDN